MADDVKAKVMMFDPSTGESKEVDVSDLHEVLLGVLGERMPALDKSFSLCGCGTCQEAADAAKKEALKLLENECPAWVMQIGLFLTACAGTILTRDRAEELSAIASMWLQKNMDANDVGKEMWTVFNKQRRGKSN